MDPEFNSSDAEPEEAALPDRWVHRGAASIETMLSDPMKLRMNSKRQSKSLAFEGLYDAGNAPAAETWKNRFEAFRRDILCQDLTSTPSGDDIIRFLSQIPDLITSRGHLKNRGAISMSTIEQALSYIKASCAFRFNAFKITSMEAMRIRSLLSTMRTEGRITSHDKHQKTWVGILLLRRMLRYHLHDSLANGPRHKDSWDRVIMKAMCMILVGSLGSRAGDVALSKGYGKACSLRYEHIKIVISESTKGSDGETLSAYITLPYQKGHKQDDQNTVYILHALQDPQDNVVCPVKMLLAHAMRIGALREQTYASVLGAIRGSPQRRLAWAHGEWPVICGMSKGAGLLEVDKPAHAKLVSYIFGRAAGLAGIRGRITTHSLRRGYARDVAHSNTTINGVAKRAVAAVLGHTASAYDRNVTTKYAGSLAHDIHRVRVAMDPFEDSLAPPVSDKAFDSTVTGEAITEYCVQHDLDSTDVRHRKRAAARLRTEKKRKWDLGGDDMEPLSGSNEAQAGPAEVDRNIDPELLLAPTNAQVSPLEVYEDQDPNEYDSTIPTNGTDEVDDGDGLALEAIDDMLATQSQEDQMNLVKECEALEGTSLADDLLLPAADFVNKLATINTYRHHGFGSGANIARGNSRDDPTPLMLNCRNKDFGCPYQSTVGTDLSTHHTFCGYTSAEKGAQLLQTKQERDERRAFACSYEGCSKTFTDRSTRNRHEKECHIEGTAESVLCDQCGKLFASKWKLTLHCRNLHAVFHPMSCLITPCKSKGHIYPNELCMKTHLLRCHQIPKKEAHTLIGPVQEEKKDEMT
ncbi:MAG: hypothetical protein Q9225_006626 [Loekoesia sp. 1 TL-2023]